MLQVQIRRPREIEWVQVRALRIAMLLDAPTAFAERVEDAISMDEAGWRARVRRSRGEASIHVVAITGDGVWAASMGAYVPAGTTDAVLYAVFVRPEYRGKTNGIADQLLDVVESWASHRGDMISLLVHEGNQRGRRFYERRGFVETGRTEPYSLNPNQREIEMVLHLVGREKEPPSST